MFSIENKIRFNREIPFCSAFTLLIPQISTFSFTFCVKRSHTESVIQISFGPYKHSENIDL